MLWRLASAWGDSPAKNSWTTCRLNSIECMRCLAVGFLLESPGQLADSQVPYLSTPRGCTSNRGPLRLRGEQEDRRSTEVLGDTAEVYCEYRSHKAIPISISVLAIVTYSVSEHPADHLSHSRLTAKSAAHTSAPARTNLPLWVRTPSLIWTTILLLGSTFRSRHLLICLHMFFGLLHTA